ncbi:hypothetical protein RFI_06219 [Reticulomyxa filosa]|uniref:Uncharacterized protein n=1 Tax=Reticulomyxa filosa TaxID=46433 RepID=X6NYJ6_RETFI|nr:hypothetical protein RFI_06219 [Reticulomyxa filosa]|eukprot:ETO30899.1 hypothetical protein RFI_06219 [Reticulomyxa filosa]
MSKEEEDNQEEISTKGCCHENMDYMDMPCKQAAKDATELQYPQYGSRDKPLTTECPYRYLGCKETLQCSPNEHLQTAAQSHLQLALRQIKQLRQQNQYLQVSFFLLYLFDLICNLNQKSKRDFFTLQKKKE